MQKVLISKPKIYLVGLSVRTSNAQEIDKLNGKMFPMVRRYFHEPVAEKIQNRVKPGTTFCVYTDYENKEEGEYTYFIGEEVSSFDFVPEGLKTLTIPALSYAKFTTPPAPMPAVIMDAWQEIRADVDLSGKRSYQADFEIYDERSSDHQNIVMDLYISIEQ
jgi:predicted transcriptional regulator YdeE